MVANIQNNNTNYGGYNSPEVSIDSNLKRWFSRNIGLWKSNRTYFLEEERKTYNLCMYINIESLETAVESSKDALDATKLGYELDSRNLVDLLQAERNYSDTQNRLAQAKYGFIVTSLQFKQAVGLLKPSDIVELNSNF